MRGGDGAMPLLKFGVFAGMSFFGAVALFLGAVVMLTSWISGEISWSYSVNGRPVAETISHARDAARFWRLYLVMGCAPVAVGLAAMLYGWRKLRS